MTKRVTIAIGKHGEMMVDFGGFAGNACLDEAEALRRRLAELGIEVELDKIRPKAPEVPVLYQKPEIVRKAVKHGISR